MATFHAPPWCPPPATTFFRLMMTGAAFDCPLILTTLFSPGGGSSGQRLAEA